MRTTVARLAGEWPTLATLAGCYLAWALGTTLLAEHALAPAVAVTALAVAMFTSLQHEMIHGHPFSSPRANAAMVFPALSVVIPYARFRDLHLAHHHDADLTDPYDDPESNYLDPARWAALPRWVRAVLSFNNTLVGRILLGPLIGQIGFLSAEWRDHRAGDARVLRGWLWHLPALAPVLVWVWAAAMPIWAYGLAVYLGLGIVKIRTFLEHRAHEKARARTAIVEDRGPLAWLFLNNNLHVVHHAHPDVAWFRLPELYRTRRARWLEMNDGYFYRGYGEVVRRHLFGRKDPVPHPLMKKRA